MRQASVVVLAALAAVSSSSLVRRQAATEAAAWDPTTRDWTDKCNEMAKYSQDNFCKVFEMCCTNDPLNGDKCQEKDLACEYDTNANSPKTFQCLLRNCTAMVTTTVPPTTASPDKKATSRLTAFLTWAASIFMLLI